MFVPLILTVAPFGDSQQKEVQNDDHEQRSVLDDNCSCH